MPPAKFVRSYANLRETLHQALISFRADVAEGRYPDDQRVVSLDRRDARAV